MTLIDTLRRARDYITPPEMWHQGSFSPSDRNGILKGEPVCAWGALCWACHTKNPHHHEVKRAHNVFDKVILFSLHEFNDSHTHQEVLNLFDRLIATLKPTLPTSIQDALDVKETDHVLEPA